MEVKKNREMKKIKLFKPSKFDKQRELLLSSYPREGGGPTKNSLCL